MWGVKKPHVAYPDFYYGTDKAVDVFVKSWFKGAPRSFLVTKPRQLGLYAGSYSKIVYEVHVCNNGDKEWFLNEKRHREDGPAIEWGNGDKSWFLNGKLHREDGPAVEGSDGTKHWCLNGKLHREDGPALECGNGDEEWWLNGERHREDGPAIDSNGYKAWYLNGEKLTEQEHKARTSKDNCEGKLVEIEGKKYKLVSVE